jgi:hypothetical protein
VIAIVVGELVELAQDPVRRPILFATEIKAGAALEALAKVKRWRGYQDL